jgi:hypothetical protein
MGYLPYCGICSVCVCGQAWLLVVGYDGKCRSLALVCGPALVLVLGAGVWASIGVGCSTSRVVTSPTHFPRADVCVCALGQATSFVPALANQVIKSMLKLAGQVPLMGPAAAVLKHMFDLYQVRPHCVLRVVYQFWQGGSLCLERCRRGCQCGVLVAILEVP